MSRVYSGDWIVTSLLVDRAERFADEVAIAAEDGRATYADLVDRAARVAGMLASLGVEPGDRVATMLTNGLDYVAAWHGIVWVGAIDVPVNVEYRGTFLQHVLRDSGATVIVVDARWLPRLAAFELGDVRHVLVVGEGVDDLPSGIERHAFADALAHDPRPRHEATETDATYIMYTSGTTGPSKGAVHCNRSSIHYIMPFVAGLDLGDDDVCYSMFPLFHQMGRSACTTAALWVGNRVELRSGFSASGFWEDVRACGATWAGYFGAVILFLWQQEPRAEDRDHGLRRAFGSSAPPELIVPWEERFGTTLFEVYGSTEIGLGSGLGSGPRKLGTMGLPCRHLEVAIVDERDEPVPAGVVGEALWRPRYPYAIFQGYWNRDDATLESFRNLWFHSGDAGLLDDEGYFVFKDRIKDSIRRRGENISSFEVERAVREQPGVVEVAAYAVPGIVPTEEDVMVAVVPAPEGPPDPPALFTALCETMPRHAVPRYLRLLDELPKTPTQRIQKFKLREDGVTADTVDREALGIFPARD
jgi:crotonobetaine/carnitine-CoA ligase